MPQRGDMLHGLSNAGQVVDAQVAHSRAAGSDINENQRNLAQMDQFLDKHKKIAKELAQNPSRGTDPNFLDHHKDLANFFDTHQELKTDFAANPTQFMQRESQFETQESSNHRLNRTAKKTNEKNENKNLEHREDLSSDRTH